MRQIKHLRTRPAALCAALVFATALGACTEQKAVKEESPAATPQPVAVRREAEVAVTPPADAPTPASATPTPAPAPPQASEARAALERIYKGAVTLDARAEGQAVAG